MKQQNNFAIFGTGLMAKIYAEIISQRTDSKIVAVAGNTEETTHQFAKSFSIPGYSKSGYKELLAAHPEVTAVLIATPESVRLLPIEAAIQYKKHILLE